MLTKLINKHNSLQFSKTIINYQEINNNPINKFSISNKIINRQIKLKLLNSNLEFNYKIKTISNSRPRFNYLDSNKMDNNLNKD